MIIKCYIDLVKPRIVLGNIFSTTGGFLIAGGKIYSMLFVKIIMGITFIVASSCIFNNIIDRNTDSLMQRTKNRILAKKKNKSLIRKSTLYAIIFGIIGLISFITTKNSLIIYLASTGMIIYVIIYSFWMKHKSKYSILIGSISGAIPPIIGYCAITNKINTGAIILFLIFSLWQIPHSYSITIFRLYDYETAHIPTFPIKKGIQLTKLHINIYIISFIAAITLFSILGYASNTFLFIMNTITLFWLYMGYCGQKYITNEQNILWAKKMFMFSILIIMTLNLLLSLDKNFLEKIITIF